MQTLARDSRGLWHSFLQVCKKPTVWRAPGEDTSFPSQNPGAFHEAC